jgi:hypothetical protein
MRPLGGLATPNVFPSRNGFQMSRIDAMPDPAQMVQLKAIRNGTDKKLISHPMGVQTLSGAPANLKLGVPIDLQRPRPEPATIRGSLHLAEKAVQRTTLRLAQGVPPWAMPPAVTAVRGRFI